jgi:hypothetical protein
MLFLNKNPKEMGIKKNHFLNDSSSKMDQIFVNLIRMTITINYERRAVSVLYLFSLSKHIMLKPVYYIGLPKADDIKEVLKGYSELYDQKELLLPKGSPFTNQSVQDFLNENQIQFNYVSKQEIPLIVRISTLYMKRMLEINSEINSERSQSFQSKYLFDLMHFWNTRIVYVTINLPTENLISKTEMTEKWKEELFKRFVKSNSYKMEENKQKYVYLLVIAKRYLRSKAPETTFILLNLFNGEIVTMKQFIGYKNDAIVLKFLKSHPFYEDDHHFFLLPKGTFEFEDKFEEYCSRHGYVYNTYENLPDKQANEFLWAASKIVQNYFRDSSNQLVPFVEPYNKDAKNAFVNHWNKHVIYIYMDQVFLSIQHNKV